MACTIFISYKVDCVHATCIKFYKAHLFALKFIPYSSRLENSYIAIQTCRYVYNYIIRQTIIIYSVQQLQRCLTYHQVHTRDHRLFLCIANHLELTYMHSVFSFPERKRSDTVLILWCNHVILIFMIFMPR